MSAFIWLAFIIAVLAIIAALTTIVVAILTPEGMDKR